MDVGGFIKILNRLYFNKFKRWNVVMFGCLMVFINVWLWWCWLLDIILDIYGLFLVRFMVISGLFRFLFNFVKYLYIW